LLCFTDLSQNIPIINRNGIALRLNWELTII